MKLIKSLSIVVVLASLSMISFAQKPSGSYAKGELLVKFRSGLSREAISEFQSRSGVLLAERLGDLGWQRIKISDGVDLKSSIAELREFSEVEAVQPNFYYQLALTPNDPQFPNANMYGLTRISAPQAWDLTTGSSAVVVANIDTGMRYTHEDLAANMWTNAGEINGNGVDDDNNGFVDDFYGYDFFFNDANPLDENGHGTHVGGTIGAAGNNALGVAGVNWNVKIMAIKIYDNDGFGTTSAMLINAYNYVRMMKNRGVNIRVTNNSYSGCDEACGYDQATKDALDAMGNAGILNVFAAGNNNANNDSTAAPAYPATYTSPSVLAVGASTNTDARAGFSSWGPVSVDLAAPGQLILSTTWGSNSSYGTLSGTSMASPHVAGAAALLSAHNPNLSVASLKATLMNTVDPVTAWAGLTKTGGRLNVFAALQNQTTCNFNLNGTSIAATTKGGHYTVNVTAPANCDYLVKSNSNWIKLAGSDTLSGNGSVTFRVSLNPTITRSGSITIAGQNVTVTQSRN
jgi:subtilisin family serine protease